VRPIPPLPRCEREDGTVDGVDALGGRKADGYGSSEGDGTMHRQQRPVPGTHGARGTSSYLDAQGGDQNRGDAGRCASRPPPRCSLMSTKAKAALRYGHGLCLCCASSPAWGAHAPREAARGPLGKAPGRPRRRGAAAGDAQAPGPPAAVVQRWCYPCCPRRRPPPEKGTRYKCSCMCTVRSTIRTHKALLSAGAEDGDAS